MFFIRNIRAVIIAWLAIPASIVATFTLMRAMDFTLNNMTLLGITLAVGIVIDDAIVVLENIFRYIEEKNCSPFEAAIRGTNEVTLAVMATTLSLVVIFLPVAFMTGYARRFINPFGWTMAFSILVSMLVSFTLTPMLSSRFLTVADAAKDHKSKEGGFFHWLDGFYTRSLNWSLDHPAADRRHRGHRLPHHVPDQPHGRAARSSRPRTWASGRFISTRRRARRSRGRARWRSGWSRS